MGVTERRARQKETLRKEILDTARRLFANEGYDSVSMRRIADEIEYSPATIYLHFTDKRDLFECLCRETLTEIGDLIEPIVTGDYTPVERLKRGLRAYIEFGLKNPEPYKVAFLVEGPSSPPADLMGEGMPARRVYQFLRNLVKECTACGEAGPAGPDCIAQTLWAGAHGLTALLIADPGFPWVDREVLIETMVATLTAGLCGAAPSANGKDRRRSNHKSRGSA
jgi:AcrR family transcriptional regulator